MQTIAVISQKGGSGKTTTVVNLAVAAHEDDQSVLVVDLDPQASATHWHRAREDKSLHVQPTHPAGLPEVLKAAARQGVDWVFIDTAAQTDNTAAESVEAADVVLVTCRPSIVDLRAITNTIRLCRIRNAQPHVVLTQIDPQGGSLRNEACRMFEGLEVDVLHEGLGRRVAFHHAMIDGRAAIEYEPDGKAAHEARALYKAVSKLASSSSKRHDGMMASKRRAKTA